MGNETVAAPRNGLYKTWLVGGVAEDFTQPHDRVVESVVEVDEGVTLPETVAKLVAGDDFSRLLQKDGQNLKGLFGKLEAHAVLAKFGCFEIDLKDAEAHDSDACSRSSHSFRAPGGVYRQ